MHPEASRGYEPARIGKIHDITAAYRGNSSVIILCPELTPIQAYEISLIQPDLMFYLKTKLKDTEL